MGSRDGLKVFKVRYTNGGVKTVFANTMAEAWTRTPNAMNAKSIEVWEGNR